MHRHWDVGAFDFEERTRLALPEESRASWKRIWRVSSRSLSENATTFPATSLSNYGIDAAPAQTPECSRQRDAMDGEGSEGGV